MTAASITFVDAVARGFRRTTDFRGRATRAEFWYWVLFVVLIRLVTSTIDGFLYPADVSATLTTNDLNQALSEMTTLVQHSLASTTFAGEILLLPSTVMVTIRRLRDAGWSPIIAVIAFAVNYVGLATTLVVSTQILAILTRSGEALTDNETTALLQYALLLVVIVLVNAGTSIAAFVGTLRPSRPSDVS